MTLCLVTDRRRLCGEARFDLARACLLRQAAFARDAGVDLIQIRERDLDGASLAALVREVVLVCRGSRTRVLVNDRVDVALACGADGVHLRGDSFPAGKVREIVPAGFLLGRSVRGPEEAETAGPVDYLIAGTVFATPSKPSDSARLGLNGLAGIVDAVRARGTPVLAIGGITLNRLGEVAAAGAAGMAGIGVFMDADARAQGCGATALTEVAEAARAVFDRFPPPF